MPEPVSVKKIVELVDNVRRYKQYKVIAYILIPIIFGFILLIYLNKKISELLEEIKCIEERLKSDIQKELDDIRICYKGIIVDDTYLIHSVRKSHQNICNNHIGCMTKLLKYQEYFTSDLNQLIESSKDEVIDIQNQITNFNSEFVERRKKEYESLFKFEENSLDDYQKTAIITDDKHNLVVAGAGSGKTEVLTTRIAYLIKRKPDTIDSRRILALAFQKKAKEEMINRLRMRYGLEVKIKTFHALGLEILELEKNRSDLFDPSEEEIKTRKLINRLFNKAMEEKDFNNEVINYLKSRDHGYVEEKTEFASDKEKEDFYEYMRSLRWRTLDN